MASLTSSGLTLESGTTTLRSILGAENVLVTSNIIPSWNQGTLKRDYDITLGNLNPGQAAYCTVTNSSDASRIQIYLPSGGKFIFPPNEVLLLLFWTKTYTFLFKAQTLM